MQARAYTHNANDSTQLVNEPGSIFDLRSVSVHTQLVLAILGDVANPRQGLVAALFHDLEVAHLHGTQSVTLPKGTFTNELRGEGRYLNA